MYTLPRTLLLSLLGIFALLFSSCADDVSGNDIFVGSPNAQNGVNSSYARLITVGNYLYAVNRSELVTFDASDPANPDEIDRQDVGFGIETIYHFNSLLFVGSQEAMFTYSLDSTGIPRRRSQFAYNIDVTGSDILPCDPVVATTDVAYVTLYTTRQGRGACGGTFTQFIERLVVVDISDIDNPQLIESLNTPTPRGLSLSEDLLFVCNERQGFTVYDVTDKRSPVVIDRFPGDAYDVIAQNGLLIVVGTRELTQYEYTPQGVITELGSISIR